MTNPNFPATHRTESITKLRKFDKQAAGARSSRPQNIKAAKLPLRFTKRLNRNKEAARLLYLAVVTTALPMLGDMIADGLEFALQFEKIALRNRIKLKRKVWNFGL